MEGLELSVMASGFKLRSGKPVLSLGQGTWRMGENHSKRSEEIAALRLGLDLGMNLIDTAEMYGEGGAEEIVSDAIDRRREGVYLVSKVYPHNATRHGAIEACERSLRRLKTDYLDLYLLHWRGSVPIQETIGAFQRLKETGKIREYGVSNFDRDDMEEAVSIPGGERIGVNQVLYNLQRRGIEWDLLPWCRQHGIVTMAYSPIEQGRLLNRLRDIAKRREATAAQIALAWLLRQKDLVVIPKSANGQHVRENHRSLNIRLSQDDLRELDDIFPPPSKKTNLEML
jgi:diketogulonate reductase-like aldo/keto reductase